MDTPKKVESGNPEWVDALFGPITLDFVAPFSLDVSLKRLKQQEVTRFFRRHRLMVDLIPDDADTFGFHVKRKGAGSGAVEARGYLKRWETESTLVTARINLALTTYIIPLLALLILLVVLESTLMHTAWFFVPIMLVMLVNLYAIRRQRHEIAHIIEDALNADSLPAN